MTEQDDQQQPSAPSSDEAVPATRPRHRHRMAPQDRERLILDNALRFFAERGLGGETRELARRLDVTQSLIYRYFPSKDVLIERVYEQWFNEYWNPAWRDWISERTLSYEERLLTFYRDYVRVAHTYEWVRLFAFSGLGGLQHHVRYVKRNREEIFPRIAGELRHEHGLPGFDDIPMTEFEHDQIWALHATQYYIGQRRWLFNLSTPSEVNDVMATRVHSFVNAAPVLIKNHLAAIMTKRAVSA